MSIRVHDGKVDIDGVDEAVQRELNKAFDELHSSLAQIKDLPPPVRAKLEGKIIQLRSTVERRMANMHGMDLDRLGEEMGKMGEEIGKIAEQIGNEAAQAAQQQVEREVERGAGSHASGGHHHVDVQVDADDADEDMGDGPDVDDDDDLGEAVRGLGDLKLAPDQHEKLARLRADSDRRVAAAKEALHAASKRLHDQIEHDASDDDIARSIDAVSHQEAEIRKARVLAWAGARRLLDEAQRKRIEAAAAKRTK